MNENNEEMIQDDEEFNIFDSLPDEVNNNIKK